MESLQNISGASQQNYVCNILLNNLSRCFKMTKTTKKNHKMASYGSCSNLEAQRMTLSTPFMCVGLMHPNLDGLYANSFSFEATETISA